MAVTSLLIWPLYAAPVKTHNSGRGGIDPGHQWSRMNSKIRKNSKKIQKNLNFFVKKLWCFFYMRANFRDEMTFVEVSAKKTKSCSKKTVFGSILEHRFCFFCWDLHECHFVMKICTHVKNMSMFVAKKIQIFLNFLNIFFVCTVAKGACELELTIALSHNSLLLLVYTPSCLIY